MTGAGDLFPWFCSKAGAWPSVVHSRGAALPAGTPPRWARVKAPLECPFGQSRKKGEPEPSLSQESWALRALPPAGDHAIPGRRVLVVGIVLAEKR